MPPVRPELPITDRLSLAPPEAAALAGVSETTLYQAINAGELRSGKFGERRIIRRVDLEDWLARVVQPASAPVLPGE